MPHIGNNKIPFPHREHKPSGPTSSGGRGSPALAGEPHELGGDILDTSTPPDDTAHRAFIAAVTAPRSRRIWSRARLGFHLPGRFFFSTLTTSPAAERHILQDLNALRRWFKRHHPAYEYLQVVTDEGLGTVHLAQRFPPESHWIDVKALRSFWIDRHQTSILKVKHIRNTDGLAVYLAEQSVRGMSKEMAYQPLVLQWSRSKHWIPPHFIPEWSRYWHQNRDLTVEQRDVHTREWVRRYHYDPQAS